MKLIIFSVIFTVFLSLAFGGITQIPNAVHKDHPGKCYIGTTNPPTILNPGDTATLASRCERAVCDRKLNVEIHTCVAIEEKKGCKKTDSPAGRPYPECCPRMKCN